MGLKLTAKLAKLFRAKTILPILLLLSSLPGCSEAGTEECRLPDVLKRNNSLLLKEFPDFESITGCSKSADGLYTFQFPVENGLILGMYNSYHLTYSEPQSQFTFEFDAGTAYRGRGTIHLFDDQQRVVSTVWSCGTSACTLEKKENGKTIIEKMIDSDYYKFKAE